MNGEKRCCSPARGGAEAIARVAEFRRCVPRSREGMRFLAGSEFLMGTDGNYGFLPDGEGPAHPVRLLPFLMDAICVTNEQFNDFVAATGYKTESERFGWSFV